MLFPIVCAVLMFCVLYFDIDGKKEKYPILKFISVCVLSLTILIVGTYFMYDVALKEVLLTAPWKEILSLK